MSTDNHQQRQNQQNFSQHEPCLPFPYQHKPASTHALIGFPQPKAASAPQARNGPKGKGVCGSAWAQGNTIVVKDVEEFPGHIACSSLSKSEIVVPVFSNSGNITAVLDIDSDTLATFDDVDKKYLEKKKVYKLAYIRIELY
jgi:hypothetical protein